MRKTALYILVLGIFAFGVWYFLFYDKDVFGADQAGFTIKDTAAIHKIFLASKKGDTVSLRRTEDGWVVNNKYPAARGMVHTLLTTLRTQKAMYPVQEEAHNNVIKALAGTGIKTELYDNNGDKIRTFYVGGQVKDNKGTHMLIEGADRPYVVQLPVYEGYLTPRYSVSELEWRDRTVMNYAADEIRKFKIDYPSEDEYLNSFTLTRTGEDDFKVATHPELNMDGELDKERIKSFMGFFQRVGLEGYLIDVEGLDSIIANADKRCSIEVTTTTGKEQQIDIYWMPVNKRSKNITMPTPGVPDDYDPDRMYGVINNYRDTVILQSQTFNKFLRKGYEFYQQGAE